MVTVGLQQSSLSGVMIIALIVVSIHALCWWIRLRRIVVNVMKKWVIKVSAQLYFSVYMIVFPFAYLCSNVVDLSKVRPPILLLIDWGTTLEHAQKVWESPIFLSKSSILIIVSDRNPLQVLCPLTLTGSSVLIIAITVHPLKILH